MFKYKKVLLIFLAVLIAIATLYSLHPPATAQDSRVSALEVDVNGLESRLNRIEAQISQITRTPYPGAPASPPPPRNLRRNQPPLSREEMFDRLATLVMETKDQVNKLQARVAKLEAQRNSN